jgi:hypothetical protein
VRQAVCAGQDRRRESGTQLYACKQELIDILCHRDKCFRPRSAEVDDRGDEGGGEGRDGTGTVTVSIVRAMTSAQRRGALQNRGSCRFQGVVGG